MTNITWNAEGYRDAFAFVTSFGAAAMDLLSAPEGSFVVDLGCGNGRLTPELVARGYRALGVDDSPEMLEVARRDYPELEFRRGNALSFELDEPADAIFSNSMLHWVEDGLQDELLAHIASQIRPGGEFVFECGGKRCGKAVHDALAVRFAAHGLEYRMPFYFPTIGEYAPRLEAAGFEVTHAFHFDRPSAQQGPDGIRTWIEMFDMAPFEGMDPQLKDQIIDEATEYLRPVLQTPDGTWYVDYVRLRMRCVRK